MNVKLDLVQMGILLISGISMIGGYWAYCEGHFATKEAVATEISERRELKAEVDAIYLRSVPEKDRIMIRHPGLAE